MHSATLRKYGGSVVLAIPPVLLQALSLTTGSTVGLSADDGRLVVQPRVRPRYTLEEIMARCDPSLPPDAEEQAWFDEPPVGLEVI